MPRRIGGHGSRRHVPDVAGLVALRYRTADSAFCRRPQRAACHWCSTLADLNAGRPVELSGARIFDALCQQDGLPDRFRDLQYDTSHYLITGPDTVETVPDPVPSPSRKAP